MNKNIPAFNIVPFGRQLLGAGVLDWGVISRVNQWMLPAAVLLTTTITRTTGKPVRTAAL